MELRKQTSVINTNINDSKAFKIAESAKAFKILSDNLYSDKILAVVRELTCNAFDAHIADDNKRPFEVHLPSYSEPHFSVKDYGIGMSHDQVMNLYSTYFGSDKTESNDFVGALGLGSKSPFAYTDAFTVESKYNGISRQYTCYIGENGTPQITLLDESKTTRRNGVEIKLPVNSDDFYAFEDKLKEATKYYRVKPKVTGKGEYKLKEYKEDIFSGEGWALIDKVRYANNPAIAIQGNVAYPISRNNLNKLTNEQNFVLSNNFIINFEMGKLDFAPSREYLSYDNETIENIKETLTKVFRLFISALNDKINKFPSLWDATIFVKDLYNKQINDRSYIEEYINYDNMPIEKSSVRVYPSKLNDTKIIKYHKKYSSISRTIITSHSDFFIDFSKDTIFVVDDGSKNAAGRCRNLILTSKVETIYFLSKTNRSFFKAIGNPKYRKLSSLEKPIIVKTKKPREKEEIFKNVDSSVSISLNAIGESKVYYITSKRGIIRDLDDNKMYDFNVSNMKNNLITLNILPEGTLVYAVPSWAAKSKKFIENKKLVNFLDFYSKKITKIVKENKVEINEYRKIMVHSNNLRAQDWTVNNIVLHDDTHLKINDPESKVLKMRSAIREIRNIESEFDNQHIYTMISAAESLGIEMDDFESQKTSQFSIVNDYPMLKTIIRHQSEDFMTEIFDYINLVDRSSK